MEKRYFYEVEGCNGYGVISKEDDDSAINFLKMKYGTKLQEVYCEELEENRKIWSVYDLRMKKFREIS